MDSSSHTDILKIPSEFPKFYNLSIDESHVLGGIGGKVML